jgi:methylated-DNA-protein-cysteine methyltransferase-like protein
VEESTDKTSFFDLVHQVVVLIPAGRVTTYGHIAKYLGTTKSARMVGWAMNACKNKPEIPAHRVVNKAGLLTGKAHFRGVPMQDLLTAEGIEVKENQIQDMEDILWDPCAELTLD